MTPTDHTPLLAMATAPAPDGMDRGDANKHALSDDSPAYKVVRDAGLLTFDYRKDDVAVRGSAAARGIVVLTARATRLSAAPLTNLMPPRTSSAPTAGPART